MKTTLAIAVLAALAAGAFFFYARQPATQALAAGAASATTAATTAAKPAASQRGGIPTVRLAPAVRQDVAIEVEANGTVVPLSSVEIRAQLARRLEQVHVREGQFVHAGALLFSLDQRSERAALDKARAQLVRDSAALDDLERQFRRSQELVAQHFISTGAADTLQTQVESQRAQWQAAQAALRAAQVELSYTLIRAPSAGRIGAINVFAGTLVQSNTVLASVTRIDPIAVSFTVPEQVLAGLLASQRKGEVAVTATLAEPARTVSGKLSFIDSAVDAVAGTIRVKAQFDNGGTQLWPGQYVHARLVVNTLRDAVVVPLSAIVTGAAGSLVYTVDAEQQARARPVRLLHSFGLHSAVAGLQAGELIVVEGKQNLRPGGKVRVAGAGALAATEYPQRERRQ